MKESDHDDQHAPLSYYGAWRIVWLVFLLIVFWLIVRVAATGDIALRAGVSSRHGPEPDRGLAAKNVTSRASSV